MLLLALKHMQKHKLCKSRTLSSVKVTFSKWHCSQKVIHDFPEGLGVAFFTICWRRSSQKDRAAVGSDSEMSISNTIEKT